jgi:hypothetical protein
MKKAVEMVLSQHFLGGTKKKYKTCTVTTDGLLTGSELDVSQI